MHVAAKLAFGEDDAQGGLWLGQFGAPGVEQSSPDEVDSWRLRKHKPCFFFFLVHFVVCITSNT